MLYHLKIEHVIQVFRQGCAILIVFIRIGTIHKNKLVSLMTRDENSLMIFPIEKRVNPELIIHKRGSILYKKGVLVNIRAKEKRVKLKTPKINDKWE